MKKIQILGIGCPKCRRLTEVAESAAREAGVEYTLEKVTDIDHIIAFGVIGMPSLVIDGEVKCVGKVPGKDELLAMLGASA